jgi:hypothetical protein
MDRTQGEKMKRFVQAVVAISVIGFSVLAYAAATCPIDGSSAHFTGTTKQDGTTGKLLYEHKCPRGHTFWTTSS